MTEEEKISLHENLEKSSDIMQNGDQDARKAEQQVYDMHLKHVESADDAQRKEEQWEREFQHKTALDLMEYELKKLETEARIQDMEERRDTEKKAKFWQVGATVFTGLFTTAVTCGFQYLMGRANLSEGKFIGEDRVKFVDKASDSFVKGLKK